MDRTGPIPETLRMYGEASDRPPLAWSWVDTQLREAGTYWTTIHAAAGAPHPRPVWGLWRGGALFLSIGSPALSQRLRAGPRRATVHLDSGTQVVILEGTAQVAEDVEAAVVEAYNAKYDWAYSHDEYGPLTRLEPAKVVAWRAAGWAGRDGFSETGRWRFA